MKSGILCIRKSDRSFAIQLINKDKDQNSVPVYVRIYAIHVYGEKVASALAKEFISGFELGVELEKVKGIKKQNETKNASNAPNT